MGRNSTDKASKMANLMQLLILVFCTATACASVMDGNSNVAFYEKLMNNPKEAGEHIASALPEGHELELEEDLWQQIGFLQQSESNSTKKGGKCAIKCRTDCADGEESPSDKLANMFVPSPSPVAAMDLDSIRKAALASKASSNKDAISMKCMNHCGGLCRQLCAKFKVLKVCNGCTRGCLKRCTQTSAASLAKDTAAQSLVQIDQAATVDPADFTKSVDLNA